MCGAVHDPIPCPLQETGPAFSRRHLHRAHAANRFLRALLVSPAGGVGSQIDTGR